MLSELNRLLSPFKRGFALYIVCTLLRQGSVVGGGYGLVLLIRSYEHNSAQSVLMAAFSEGRVAHRVPGKNIALLAQPFYAEPVL